MEDRKLPPADTGLVVSIVTDGSGVYEVWLSLERQAEGCVDGDTPDRAEELLSRCILRTRNRDAAIHLVAGVLETWR